jgi:uncharacterized protein
MALDTKARLSMNAAGAATQEIDQGLRTYMLSVYNYMGSALALSGVVAFLVATNQTLQQVIFGTGLMWLFVLAPIGLVFFLSARIAKMKSSTAQMVFWVFAGMMGISLSSILLQYTGASVARVFFITAGTFGAMSLYGYTTKKDLTKLGSLMMMGLIGIIIASVVNMFMASSALHFAISVIGVLVFVGLTAYDTQKIRQMYYAADSSEVANKKAIMGALNLYLDFINLFIMLMHLFGQRD